MTLFTRYILPVLVLCLSVFSASGQVSANFTTDVVSGCSPLVVHFTNTTGSCPSCTYTWQFGNGSPTSPSPGPVSTSYIAPGTYTATLTVDDGGAITTHSVTITVFPAPTVSFTASATSVCPGTPITFTSTTLGGVPGPVTYTWSFGDGLVGTGASPVHTYYASGDYNITLFATNSEGCQSSLMVSAYIHVYTPATPNFYASTTYFCSAPGVAVFTNATTGTGGFTYTWEFGDGTPNSSSTDPTHNYTSPGSYTVTLIVTDGDGCTDSIKHTSYITVGNLMAGFSGPDTACVNTSVTFANTTTPSSAFASTWTFGDGSGPVGSGTGHHVYTTAGTYTVKLVVFDGTCYDSITHTVVILPGPVASFTITPAHPCPPPTTLTFTGTAPSGTSITWIDGDGGPTGSGTTFSHTYTHRGIYTIKMIVTDLATGCVDTVAVKDTLYDLVFSMQAVPTSGCKPLTVDFSTNALTNVPDSLLPGPYPYGISSYSWNYGDGSPSGTGAAPSHVYTAAGVYTAVVTVITGNGCTVTDSIKIYVGQPPVVNFTATPLHECYRDNSVLFTATVISGPVTDYVWNFGDGTSQTDSTPTTSHHYTIPGVFSVTLTAYYNGCPSAPVIITDYITIDSPKAIIKDIILCSPPNTVEFGDSSLGDNTHLWIFGDGTTSTASNPVHDYPSATTYTVTLATYNAGSGCRDTATIAINLTRPLPHFTANDTVICSGEHIQLTATVTGGTAADYYWTSPGGIISGGTSVVTDTFYTSGIYTIALVIVDQNGCQDTVTRTNYITVAQPVPNFTVSPASGCSPLTVTFTDNSTDVAGSTLTGFLWAYGDGTTGAGVSSTHTFTASGTFSTKDVVTDNFGCKDSITLPLVTVYKPAASFTASTTFPCAGTAVNFTNTSAGGVSYSWNFGDGGTSTATSPMHTYSVIGIYTVKLIATDANGCTDTATYVGYINVNHPLASFYMDDSFSICPPLTVHFINTSTGAVSYAWTLGDGTSSAAPSPGDLYITAGMYTVQMIATNVYGCKDTAIGHVTIYGYAGAFSYAPVTGCSPLTVHFNAAVSNVPSVVWDFSDGNTSAVSGVDTISHVYTIPGAYVPKLILSDNTGCQASSLGIDTIKVDAVTAGFKENPNPVCLDVPFNFVDTSQSYWSTITAWSWLFNSSTSNIASPSFVITTPGVYPATLQVTDAWGCTGTVTEDINVFPAPVITVSPDTIICVGDAATLTGYGGVSYTWSPAATLSCTACNPAMASPVVVTSYTVTGTDSHGCINTDTTTVLLKTKTVSVAYRDTSICQGSVVQLIDSGATKFTWTPTAGLSSADIADPLSSPAQTTKYTVIAQLSSCIADTNYVVITVYPVPTVNAGPDQTVVDGIPVQLTARGTDVATYWWDNANLLSCDSCPNPVATMSVTTHFTVNAVSSFGCTASDSVTVFIFCDKSQVFIPNSFTPNGDGQDDVFYPRGSGISIIKSFRIYNRWGQLLFERDGININDVSNAWDGSYNGGPPRPDVYVYIIDATCETGAPVNLKGDVTIIR